MKNRISLLILIFTIISMMMTGCKMLPQKEVIKAAPVLKEYEPQTYKLVTVEKGTVALEKDIDCTYAQMMEEDLSFNLTGVMVSHIYYSAGDSVKKGDLLAELNIDSLEEELGEAEYNIGEMNLLISQNKELSDLEIKKQKLVSEQSGLSKDDAKEAADAIKSKYDAIIESYKDSLFIAETQKASVSKKIENHRIYAGMDGTISYIKQTSISVKNDVIIKIIDDNQSAFVAPADDTSYFTEGEEVTVVTADNSYDAIVHLPTGKDGSMYFQLKIPDLNIDIGEKGSVHLELEKHENTLYLPARVVHKAGDSYYVYYVDETGVQNMKTVEVGIENEDNIEITNGLDNGEAVIDK